MGIRIRVAELGGYGKSWWFFSRVVVRNRVDCHSREGQVDECVRC